MARMCVNEVLATLGMIPNPIEEHPKWARQALKEFWRSSGLVPEPEKLRFDEKYEGHFSGIASARLKEFPVIGAEGAAILQMISDEVTECRKVAATLSPSDASEFFNAQKRGFKIANLFSQLPQRAKIYGTIAACWQRVGQFKSSRELFLWLMSLQEDGNYLLARETDSRELRFICQKIGLRFSNRGGRPSKSRTGTTK